MQEEKPKRTPAFQKWRLGKLKQYIKEDKEARAKLEDATKRRIDSSRETSEEAEIKQSLRTWEIEKFRDSYTMDIAEEAFIAGQSLGDDKECEKCEHKYSEHNHDEEDMDFSCDINGCQCEGFLEYD
jgi:hypothetical protein